MKVETNTGIKIEFPEQMGRDLLTEMDAFYNESMKPENRAIPMEEKVHETQADQFNGQEVVVEFVGEEAVTTTVTKAMIGSFGTMLLAGDNPTEIHVSYDYIKEELKRLKKKGK